MQFEPQTIRSSDAMLVVIDFQTRLLPQILDHETAVRAAAVLIRAAAEFEIPVLASAQYIKGLGPLHEQVQAALDQIDASPKEKAAFSLWRDQACRDAIQATGRKQIIVAGIEGHVCVQQTVMDLLGAGCSVFLCADAVSSRRDLELDLALSRMQQAGAVLTTCESLLFELCEISGTPRFKRVLEWVKEISSTRE